MMSSAIKVGFYYCFSFSLWKLTATSTEYEGFIFAVVDRKQLSWFHYRLSHKISSKMTLLWSQCTVLTQAGVRCLIVSWSCSMSDVAYYCICTYKAALWLIYTMTHMRINRDCWLHGGLSWGHTSRKTAMRQKRLENTLKLRVKCAVREHSLPLIPRCRPVLCNESEAVTQKLNELAMNFPPRLWPGTDSTLKGCSIHYNCLLGSCW